jgi:small GTP-binding protein
MKKRILIVEDNVRIATLMRNDLADLDPNLEVETAVSGEAALQQIGQSVWNLVVTDNRMSGITGLELIETLRERAPSTLTVLTTAFGTDEVQQAAHRLNVYHYLPKPFTLEDLERVIKDALELEDESSAEVASSGEERTEQQSVKITLGGEGGVGKTTLIRRLCTGSFEETRRMTIGVDFHLYDLQHNQSTTRLIVWDVSGQDRFAFTRRAFYRGSKAVALVYAVNDRSSFEHLERWRDEIREILPKVPLAVAANKIDMQRQVSVDEGAALAQAWGIPFFETSCLTGVGVEDFFTTLSEEAFRQKNQLSVFQ